MPRIGCPTQTNTAACALDGRRNGCEPLIGLAQGQVATSDLFDRILQTPAAQRLVRRAEGGGLFFCCGVAQPAWAFLTVLLGRVFPTRPVVVITENTKAQEIVHDDIATWLGLHEKNNVPPAGQQHLSSSQEQPEPSAMPQLLFFPAWDVLPHEDRLPHVDVISDRLGTLVALSDRVTNKRVVPKPSAPSIVVTSVNALMQRTFAPMHLFANTRLLEQGAKTDLLELVEWLEARGYEPEARVTQKGEVSLRGGIVDCWPVTSPQPVRLEFFGNELESLRHFDPVTQLSCEKIASVVLPPAGELGLLKRALAHQASSTSGPTDTLQAGQDDGHSQKTDIVGTLLDYLPADSIVVLLEPEQVALCADEYAAQIPAVDKLHCAWPDLQVWMRGRGLTILEITEADENATRIPAADTTAKYEAGEQNLANLQLQSLELYRPLTDRPPDPPVAEAQRRDFFNQLHRWLRQGYSLHVFCSNYGERQRFCELWAEYGLAEGQHPNANDGAAQPIAQPPQGLTGLNIWLGTLSAGFLCDSAKFVVVTDAEIFGRYKIKRPRRLRLPQATAAGSVLDIDFNELEEGDLVVHVQHGIGRYLGLKRLPIATAAAHHDDNSRSAGIECIVIEYAPAVPGGAPPKLYVPVTEAHLVSKYIGAGRARPPLSVLGGKRWAKTKAAAARAVRDIAAELLALQAARESQPGHAFAPDTPWQREFESGFIYEETPDQLRAIEETKADMEKPKPMDRLICGDAGFGKTEVAIRAAFKAVMDGKQVAVLVPTTVLAQQHYNTFRDRMAAWPVRIELLSRFRTRAQQQRIIRHLATGSVDIVIGTHRLLQDDVEFKDLGLVVIDEEQRFGVLHKEKLKMMRRLVDVLTLTATPIPRTLYLALCGARDMSVIQTPPQDRLPVETIVCQYDERVVRDAIQRELNRGGQVFYLHNRVMTIHMVAQKLRELVPHARIVVAHGQLPSDELEDVMTQFVNGQADVLLSTTIIESGLDIPNANTIIIDRADRFGLSDLYQLRGRVGRYKHQAYAYLLLPKHARLLTDVRKRISAIKQYSTLGCGFKVAMRDLEIRGAGNLLGREQSGHITAVGFDLYCKLLKQSIAALKGQQERPQPQVEVKLDFLVCGADTLAQSTQHPRHRATRELTGAVIPQSYIADPVQRIEIYRRLSQATKPAELQQLKDELRDRFGPVPQQVSLLLQIAELKILAAALSITAIEVKEDKLMLKRQDDYITVGGRFPRLKRKTPTARLNEIKALLHTLRHAPPSHCARTKSQPQATAG